MHKNSKLLLLFLCFFFNLTTLKALRQWNSLAERTSIYYHVHLFLVALVKFRFSVIFWTCWEKFSPLNFLRTQKRSNNCIFFCLLFFPFSSFRFDITTKFYSCIFIRSTWIFHSQINNFPMHSMDKTMQYTRNPPSLCHIPRKLHKTIFCEYFIKHYKLQCNSNGNGMFWLISLHF